MTVPAADFVGRFLLHVLPSGFQKVRAYGFLAPRRKTAALAAIREDLGAAPPEPPPDDESAPERVLPACAGTCLRGYPHRQTHADRRLTGVDVTLCPVCKAGRLAFVRDLPASACLCVYLSAWAPAQADARRQAPDPPHEHPDYRPACSRLVRP